MAAFASLCCPQGGAVDIGSSWLWLPRAHQWRYQCRIAAQHGAVGRRSVAASVIRPCCEADKSPGLLRSRVRFRGRQANVHDEYLRARPQPRLLRALLGPWHCRLGFGCWLSCFPAIIAGGGLLTQVAAAGARVQPQPWRRRPGNIGSPDLCPTWVVAGSDFLANVGSI